MPATDPPLELRPLTLRVHWTDGGGRAVPFDLVVPVGRPVRLGREPRQPATRPQPDPEFGADLVADKRDLHVSNNHATLVWDGVRLRVQKRPGANNPVFVLDRDNPAAPPRPADDFTCGPFDQFRIGNTQFTLLPGAEPVERSCSGEELAGLAFVDAEHHLDALAELPDLIHRAADECNCSTGCSRSPWRGCRGRTSPRWSGWTRPGRWSSGRRPAGGWPTPTCSGRAGGWSGRC